METGPQMASGTISPFFKLPLELRYEVYSEVLADGTTHYIIRHNGTKQAEPGLLKVCSDIRHEAMQFYYGRNQFGHVISNANITPAISWLHLIGTERLSHIRKLTFIIASSNWEANYYRHGDGRVLNVAALWVTKRSNWEPLLDKLQVSGVRDTAVRFRRSTRFEEDVQLEQFLGPFQIERLRYRLQCFAVNLHKDFLLRRKGGLNRAFGRRGLYLEETRQSRHPTSFS